MPDASQNHDRTALEPVKRRTFLKSGASAVGAAAVGGTALQSDRLAPVGNSKAIPTAIVPIGMGVVFAGAAAYKMATGGGDDSSPVDKATQDAIVDIAYSWQDIKRNREFLDKDLSQMAGVENFKAAAWQDIRLATAQGWKQDKSSSEVAQEVSKKLDKRATKAIINFVRYWNVLIESITSDLVLAAKKEFPSADTSDYYVGGFPNLPGPSTVSDPWTGFDAGLVDESNSKYIVAERPLSKSGGQLPADPRDIDGVDVDDDEIPLLAYMDTQAEAFAPVWGGKDDSTILKAGSPETGKISFGGTHGDVDGAISAIQSSLSTLKNQDMQQYIDKMYQAFNEGVSKPADVISVEQLTEQSGDADEQTRLMVNLIAGGQTAPAESGYQAKISHPDLTAESLWGWIVPQFPSGAEQTLQAGSTLAAENYNGAYFFFKNAKGETEKYILSGDEPLEILDLSGVEGEEQITSGDDTSQSDSSVTVWTGSSESNAPEPLQFPADHSDYKLVISGAQNKSTHALTEVEQSTQDGTVSFSVPSTSLNAGEAVDDIALVPGIKYNRGIETVADPSTLTTEDVKNELEHQQKLYEAFKEYAESNDDGGGIGGFLDGVGNPLGGIKNKVSQLVGALILFMLGMFGLSAMTS